MPPSFIPNCYSLGLWFPFGCSGSDAIEQLHCWASWRPVSLPGFLWTPLSWQKSQVCSDVQWWSAVKTNAHFLWCCSFSSTRQNWAAQPHSRKGLLPNSFLKVGDTGPVMSLRPGPRPCLWEALATQGQHKAMQYVYYSGRCAAARSLLFLFPSPASPSSVAATIGFLACVLQSPRVSTRDVRCGL